MRALWRDHEYGLKELKQYGLETRPTSASSVKSRFLHFELFHLPDLPSALYYRGFTNQRVSLTRRKTWKVSRNYRPLNCKRKEYIYSRCAARANFKIYVLHFSSLSSQKAVKKNYNAFKGLYFWIKSFVNRVQRMRSLKLSVETFDTVALIDRKLLLVRGLDRMKLAVSLEECKNLLFSLTSASIPFRVCNTKLVSLTSVPN